MYQKKELYRRVAETAERTGYNYSLRALGLLGLFGFCPMKAETGWKPEPVNSLIDFAFLSALCDSAVSPEACGNEKAKNAEIMSGRLISEYVLAGQIYSRSLPEQNTPAL